MAKFTDALRGYAFEIMKREQFVCCYCGLDGKECFQNWLQMTWEHLLPKGHPDRDDPRFITCACNFCNVADNRYFDQTQKRGIELDGLTPAELIGLRKEYVYRTRNAYHEFWLEQVNVG